mgnify:CR=1 FL=1
MCHLTFLHSTSLMYVFALWFIFMWLKMAGAKSSWKAFLQKFCDYKFLDSLLLHTWKKKPKDKTKQNILGRVEPSVSIYLFLKPYSECWQVYSLNSVSFNVLLHLSYLQVHHCTWQDAPKVHVGLKVKVFFNL